VPVASSCNPSYSGGRDQEDPSLKPALAKVPKIPSQKYPTPKRVGRVAQVTKHLPKHEALSSNPSTE
jgi:hypothetical protein